MIVRVAALLGAATFMLAPLLVAGKSIIIILSCISACLVWIQCVLTPLVRFVADCECGYSVNKTTDASYEVFTDLLESDFTTLTNITKDTDWVIQAWEVDKVASRGPYGRKTELRNVISNPAKNASQSSTGINGDEAGLELFVRKLGSDKEHISVAEVDSKRTDMRYGSFRAGIKATDIDGTCGAFFWYGFITASCFEIREITDTNRCTGISMTLRRSTWNFSPPRLTRQCRLSILSFILRSPRLKEEMPKAHRPTRSFLCLLTQQREFTNTALVRYACRHCRILWADFKPFRLVTWQCQFLCRWSMAWCHVGHALRAARCRQNHSLPLVQRQRVVVRRSPCWRCKNNCLVRSSVLQLIEPCTH